MPCSSPRGQELFSNEELQRAEWVESLQSLAAGKKAAGQLPPDLDDDDAKSWDLHYFANLPGQPLGRVRRPLPLLCTAAAAAAI